MLCINPVLKFNIWVSILESILYSILTVSTSSGKCNATGVDSEGRDWELQLELKYPATVTALDDAGLTRLATKKQHNPWRRPPP